jgi:hypothetical protein
LAPIHRGADQWKQERFSFTCLPTGGFAALLRYRTEKFGLGPQSAVETSPRCESAGFAR